MSLSWNMHSKLASHTSNLVSTKEKSGKVQLGLIKEKTKQNGISNRRWVFVEQRRKRLTIFWSNLLSCPSLVAVAKVKFWHAGTSLQVTRWTTGCHDCFCTVSLLSYFLEQSSVYVRCIIFINASSRDGFFQLEFKRPGLKTFLVGPSVFFDDRSML